MNTTPYIIKILTVVSIFALLASAFMLADSVIGATDACIHLFQTLTGD